MSTKLGWLVAGYVAIGISFASVMHTSAKSVSCPSTGLSNLEFASVTLVWPIGGLVHAGMVFFDADPKTYKLAKCSK